MNFDQTAYLTEAYRLQERVLGHGLGGLFNQFNRAGRHLRAVTATVDVGTGVQLVPASFRRVDNGYEIQIDTSSLIPLPATESVSIRLRFSTFFVPKILGNSDPIPPADSPPRS